MRTNFNKINLNQTRNKINPIVFIVSLLKTKKLTSKTEKIRNHKVNIATWYVMLMMSMKFSMMNFNMKSHQTVFNQKIRNKIL